ncbi:MAG: DUF1573 domain-containing protein [Chitinophagaceae bacterium]
MKKLLVAAAALFVTVAMNAQTNFDDVAKVNTEKHDFGKILQGKPVDYYFEITNKSDKPIVIEYAQASCGCTTPEVPKEPIAPGSSAKIKVSYNAAGTGIFTKTVTIKLAGIDQPKIVTITGEQLIQAEYDQYVKEHPVQTPATTIKPATTKETKTKTKTAKTKTKTKTGS